MNSVPRELRVPVTVSIERQAPQTLPPKPTKLDPIPESNDGTAHNAHNDHYEPHISSQNVQQPVEEAVAEPWVDRFEEDLRGRYLQNYDFPQRLAILGDAHLLFRRKPEEKIWDIQLGTLQRMVIHDLQRQLVMLVSRIHATQLGDETKMTEAMTLLDKYSSAIRNYDLMNEKNSFSRDTRTRDPFLITAEDRTGWLLMKEANLFQEISRVHKRRRPSTKDKSAKYEQQIDPNLDWTWDCERNFLPEDARSRRSALFELNMFIERLILGIFGGIAIIAPMLGMALSNSLRTSLVVTSVATMVFAIVLALPLPIFSRNMNGPTVLASVAAYAAVLVVFVGTSLALPS